MLELSLLGDNPELLSLKHAPKVNAPSLGKNGMDEMPQCAAASKSPREYFPASTGTELQKDDVGSMNLKSRCLW